MQNLQSTAPETVNTVTKAEAIATAKATGLGAPSLYYTPGDYVC